MNKLGGVIAGLLSLWAGWQFGPVAQAATTYPIAGIRVVASQTYLTNRQSGKGYHITVLPGHRVAMRANLHLKAHQQTVWTRQERADIYQGGRWQRYYLVKNAAHQSGWVAARDLRALPATSLALKVPLISQLPELPTGCEMTATTMMLQYAGIKIDKLAFADATPRTADPNTGFVGDPHSEYGVGLYVYPQGLLPTVRRYLPTAVDLSGMSLVQLKERLANHRPVVVWVTGLDGFASHTVTMTGYTPTTLTYNDPWTGRAEVIGNQEFDRIWQQNGRRALSY